MEDSDKPPTYLYTANVKDKVKKLESSITSKPADQNASILRRNSRKISVEQSPSNHPITVVVVESKVKQEVPAVITVETTQIYTPHAKTSDVKDTKRSYARKISVMNSEKSNISKNEDDPEPGNVKSLLEKFSSGVSQRFTRRSSIPNHEIKRFQIQSSKSFHEDNLGEKYERRNSVKKGSLPIVNHNTIESNDNIRNDEDLEPGKNLLEKFSYGISQKFARRSSIPNHEIEELNLQSSHLHAQIAEANISNSGDLSTPKTYKSLVSLRKEKVISSAKSLKLTQESDKNTTERGHGRNANSELEPKLSVTKIEDKIKLVEDHSGKLPLFRGSSDPHSENILSSNTKSDDNNKIQLKKKIPADRSSLTPSPLPRRKVRLELGNLPSKTEKDSLASILLIGSGRGGKSAIANFLLMQDISPVHEKRPASLEILECSATIKMCSSEDFGQLKLFDVPGFSIRNEEEDCQLMSTLITHLDSKDGLQGKIPSLVLVIVEYDSDGEEFSNFLRVLSHFQTHFLTKNASNVAFVVTHITPDGINDYDGISAELSTFISKHSQIREPIILYHMQNQNMKAEISNSLTDSFEKDPRNLINFLRPVYQTSHENLNNLEEAILRSAFGPDYPQSLIECCLTKRIPVQSLQHPEVIKTRKALQYAYLNIEPSEISTLLEIGWENVEPKLRERYQSSLLTLQQIFQRFNIKEFNNLPEEPLKVLHILKQIPHHNPAVADLLIETLQLKVPSCFPALNIGQGFDISKDCSTHVSPFQFSGGLKTSPVGLVPQEIGCKLTDDREIFFKFFYSFEDYAVDRLKDLGIKYVQFPKDKHPIISNNRVGYNIIKPNQEPTKSTTTTAKIEYRVFQLSLSRGEHIEFKTQFWETLSTLPDLDMKTSATIESWNEFFNYWGSHVVHSAFGGGSIQVNFRGKMLSQIFKSLQQESVLPVDEYDTSKVFQWITGDGLNFVASKEDSKVEFLQGYDVDTSFQGGELKFQQTDLTKLPHAKVAEVREEWLRSLVLNPVILETNFVLVPLSYFVREKSEEIATKMDVAFHYFYSNYMSTQGRQSSCSIL